MLYVNKSDGLILYVGNYQLTNKGLIINDSLDICATSANTDEIDVAPPRYVFKSRVYYKDEKYVFDDSDGRVLNMAKTDTIKYLNEKISEDIISGFSYEIDGEKLKFSYDAFDQQNFADTANACLLTLSGTDGLPSQITWNGYKDDGTLKRVVLDAQGFLRLYTEGALAHKARCMENGGKHKAMVENCSSMEEILPMMDEIGVPSNIGMEDYEILD